MRRTFFVCFSGFTLIEMLFSIGLFALLTSGILTSFSAFVESTERSDAQSALEDEGMYLMDALQMKVTGGHTVQNLSSDASALLTDSGFSLMNSSFLNTYVNGTPVGIHASFSLSTQSRGGMVLTQSFARDLLLPL